MYGLPDSAIIGTTKMITNKVHQVRLAPREKLHIKATNEALAQYALWYSKRGERVANRNTFWWNVARGLRYYIFTRFLFAPMPNLWRNKD